MNRKSNTKKLTWTDILYISIEYLPLITTSIRIMISRHLQNRITLHYSCAGYQSNLIIDDRIYELFSLEYVASDNFFSWLFFHNSFVCAGFMIYAIGNDCISDKTHLMQSPEWVLQVKSPTSLWRSLHYLEQCSYEYYLFLSSCSGISGTGSSSSVSSCTTSENRRINSDGSSV